MHPEKEIKQKTKKVMKNISKLINKCKINERMGHSQNEKIKFQQDRIKARNETFDNTLNIVKDLKNYD